jgi:uncharacterized protein (UPF0332 family)
MISENIRELVKYRIEQAEESLEAAELLHGKGLERPSLNRAYYAMFYAVLALLATLKRETSKHSGAIALFDLEYVKPGIFSKDLSKWLHEAFELRQRSDYTSGFQISSEEVETLLENAMSFVAEVKILLAKDLS